MTTNIKYIKQYKEDLWGFYSFRKKRDKLTTLLDLLKVYKLIPARAYYYKVKFYRKNKRKKKQYKKDTGIIKRHWHEPFAFELTNVKPRLFFVDGYKEDLINTNSYELLLFFLGLFGRSNYAVFNFTNNMYLRLQNLYTMIFLLTKNTQQQKKEFFLRFILNIRSFYPNFKDYLYKNKLTLKHIRNGLIKQNRLFLKIEMYNFKLNKNNINKNILDIMTKDFDKELFIQYNSYRQKKLNKKNLIIPSNKFIQNFENQSLYQLKKLFRNLKQSLIKYPFFNFYRNLEHQEMYSSLLEKINFELETFIKKTKKYFNINVKNNILVFLNPKIKVIKTDLKIINKLLQNPKYLILKNSLLKLKYFLIVEKNVYINKFFIKTTNSHKKFILFQLIYKKEPFNILKTNIKNFNNNQLIFFKKVNKKKSLLLRSFRFYKKSTQSKNINFKNKTKLEIKSKVKNYKKKELINYFMHNEFY